MRTLHAAQTQVTKQPSPAHTQVRSLTQPQHHGLHIELGDAGGARVILLLLLLLFVVVIVVVVTVVGGGGAIVVFLVGIIVDIILFHKDVPHCPLGCLAVGRDGQYPRSAVRGERNVGQVLRHDCRTTLHRSGSCRRVPQASDLCRRQERRLKWRK